ncbi:MAG: lipoyl(octanoyl) transferase LipB [SAR86 cluster bacterium]|nr:lipoyl(octanoyl) transferase LipB [SAR86 cluster bacterium]
MNLKLRKLGIQDYRKTWASMQNVILSKGKKDPDELWLLEHFPVYTLGFGASEDHLLSENSIPVVRSDRGGEVTYHGPGQIVAYFLINLRRKKWGPKKFVNELEASVIDFLKEYNISSTRRSGDPGIYVKDKKISSVGLKIKRGFSYHGLSINIDMDLSPFENINVCGNKSLKVTHLNKFAEVSIDKAFIDFEKTAKKRLEGIISR